MKPSYEDENREQLARLRDFCAMCGEPATWLLSGNELGHAFTNVPHCQRCADELEDNASISVGLAVRL